MSKLLFERVVIIGPGLIGGSLGMALKAEGLAGCVVGVGHRQVSLDKALECGAIDEASLDATDVVGDADLVVLCTSVGLILRDIAALAPLMKPGAIVTDVGSVKESICVAAREALKERDVFFVGSHPLAGSEQRGIDAARADLFRDAVCILTPDVQTDAFGAAQAGLRTMWEAVGSVVKEFAPDVHDRLLAEISHLPHVAAAALVLAASDDALPLAATGFMDTTRVASGDARLWVDICLANRDGLLASLDALQSHLAAFTTALTARDDARLLQLFADAKTRRDDRLTDK